MYNPLNGQDVEDAIRQYKTDRDPREPLLAYGHCLAHLAVDPELVRAVPHVRTVCVVTCERSPEPVFLRWKRMEASVGGDFYVRSGPGTVKLPPESAAEFIRTTFPAMGKAAPPADGPAST